MYRGYKIVPFIPAGRRNTMELLTRYLMVNRDIVDEVQIWDNTPNQNDRDWFQTLDKDFFKIMELPKKYKFFCPEDEARKWGIKSSINWIKDEKGNRHKAPIQFNTGRFYEYTIDPKTIYIRFDDDVVYIDDNYFKNMLDFRIDHPEYLVTFGNIWNNAIISYIAQQNGTIGNEYGVVHSPFCMDSIGWGDGEFAIYIHELMLEAIESGRVDDMYLRPGVGHKKLKDNKDHYELLDCNRFSISNFAFFGSDFAKFGGIFPEPVTGKMDEEMYIAEILPKELGRSNVIVNNALCVHYTFSPYQKPYVKETDILERYNSISEKIYSDNYYKFLTEGN